MEAPDYSPLDLSIIIPCYNVAPYIERCLHSIEKAHWGPYRYEVLCVDDASEDETGTILRQASQKGQTVRLIRNEKNLGPGVSRNVGLQHARGRYVWFIDSDDCLVEGADVEKILSCAISEGIDIVEFAYEAVELNGWKHLNRQGPEGFCGRIYEGEDYFYRCVFQGLVEFVVWNKVFKRDFLLSNKLFFNEENSYAEDVEIFPSFFCFHQSRVMRLNEVLYVYYHRRGSITHDDRVDRVRSLSYFSIMRSVEDLIEQAKKEIKPELSSALYSYLKTVSVGYVYLYSLSPSRIRKKLPRPGWKEWKLFVRTKSWKMILSFPIFMVWPYGYRVLYRCQMRFNQWKQWKRSQRCL